MKSTKSYTIRPKHLRNARALRRSQAADSPPTAVAAPPASTVRTTTRHFANPVDYRHPYESMGRFTQALAHRYDANRTRHAYYRQLRLLHEHFALDPALLTETHLRDYFLFVKLQKHWKPKSIRLALAAVLHTWNQQLGFHPHIHCLVPGAGLDERGRFVRVRKPEYLLHLPLLQAAFREQLRDLFRVHQWQVDPAVWGRDWGVHIQAAGNGRSALKYLGAYVARTALSDARMVGVDEHSVRFRWKNRAAGNRREICTLPGVEFVARYLRHVLPRGLRSIRYYGFCHPAARAHRLRVQIHAGGTIHWGASTPPASTPAPVPLCPCCRRPMRSLHRIPPTGRQRGPPATAASTPSTPSTPALP